MGEEKKGGEREEWGIEEGRERGSFYRGSLDSHQQPNPFYAVAHMNFFSFFLCVSWWSKENTMSTRCREVERRKGKKMP